MRPGSCDGGYGSPAPETAPQLLQCAGLKTALNFIPRKDQIAYRIGGNISISVFCFSQFPADLRCQVSAVERCAARARFRPGLSGLPGETYASFFGFFFLSFNQFRRNREACAQIAHGILRCRNASSGFGSRHGVFLSKRADRRMGLDGWIQHDTFRELWKLRHTWSLRHIGYA